MTYRSFSLIPSFTNNLLSERFSQMDNLFSRLTGEKPLSDIPSYNLLQKDRDNYELTVSVPGYSKEELDISVLENQLSIVGKPTLNNQNEEMLSSTSKEEKKVEKWLNKGFSKVPFSLNFNLDHRINIKYADLDKGLLSLKFCYEIPEGEKPKKVVIGVNKESSNVIEHSK
ncbi:Hsp20 family protein [Candidatus Schneideria nysicola]|uniref:Hsp20 family protein n=1 Tax=Candidatus Schneideria nysicola TaxID=1081631 RepID=UPI001CAA4955|nr:Hsp20 family protein [Candidatus Schneideria nysicola]UAJ65579.1 Hsp20 family protein [Candidatus Schneideria nysicola]